jgi:hypothetical protein
MVGGFYVHRSGSNNGGERFCTLGGTMVRGRGGGLNFKTQKQSPLLPLFVDKVKKYCAVKVMLKYPNYQWTTQMNSRPW